MVLIPVNDNRIVDNHFLTFECYDSGVWVRYLAYARALEYDRDDAQMLTFVNHLGHLRHYNPVRNLRVQPCR